MTPEIGVINPVTPEKFVEVDQSYLNDVLPDSNITVKSIEKGPKSVETEFLQSFALKEIVKVINSNKDDFDGFLINCFADPGVEAARRVTDKPVFGCGEPSMHLASLLGHKFGLITVKNSQRIIEDNIRKYGLNKNLALMEQIDLSVLELDENPGKVVKKVSKKEERIRQSGGEVILLGCTGMASIKSRLKNELTLPLVEPLHASARMLNSIIELGVEHYSQSFYSNPDYSKLDV